MFHLKRELSQGCALALICLVSLQMQQPAQAEVSSAQGEHLVQPPPEKQSSKDSFLGTPLSNLYDNLLQREYAGPVVFPNHQVERKAQRSPSLRLRFGRSDPDMLNSIVEKRWFGDVNQKPIRSPSLRLRFGRRDPSLPQMRRTAYDDLLERELTLNWVPSRTPIWVPTTTDCTSEWCGSHNDFAGDAVFLSSRQTTRTMNK
nr:short neuropeptide F precursor [Drosophila melanogaster]